MALTLDQVRKQNPIYDGVPDDIMFNDIHQKYYPDVSREELANDVGYALPELMPKPATLFSGNRTISAIDLLNDFAVVAGHLLIKGGVAFVIFKSLTLGLSRHSIISAHQQGRWLSGWFVGATILIQSLKQLTDGKYLDFFGLLILTILVAWIMGYVIGVLWFKFRNYKKNYDHNSIHKIDERYWEFAENEFNSERKTGLWAESYAEAKGDENFAKAIYLKKRATQLAIKGVVN
jgi:hypothetical protein